MPSPSAFHRNNQTSGWYVRLLLMEGKTVHFTLAALCLLFDCVTGPSVQVAITFTIPVATAAWFAKPSYAYTLAILQPLIRMSFPYLFGSEGTVLDSASDLTVRITVLMLIGWLISTASRRTRALTREVYLLERILPICPLCRRLRNSRGQWQPLDQFATPESIPVSKRRAVCPDCLRGEGI